LYTTTAVHCCWSRW